MAIGATAGPPFRAEVIGSLLRPRRLEEAGWAALGPAIFARRPFPGRWHSATTGCAAR